MPSFDIVSEVDMHELQNAIDQANREIENRFDFKGSGASYAFSKENITLTAPSDFQIKQMQEILQSKLAKRKIDVKSLDYQDIQISIHQATQIANICQGIETQDAKKIVKIIKESKLKVQSSIQGEQVRVTGKKRDDLQDVMAIIKDSSLELPLQFTNFRD